MQNSAENTNENLNDTAQLWYEGLTTTLHHGYHRFTTKIRHVYMNPLALLYPSAEYSSKNLIAPSNTESFYSLNSIAFEQDLYKHAPDYELITDPVTLHYYNAFVDGSTDTTHKMRLGLIGSYPLYSMHANIDIIENTTWYLNALFSVWDLFIPARFSVLFLPAGPIKNVISYIFSALNPIYSALSPIFSSAQSWAIQPLKNIENSIIGIDSAKSFSTALDNFDRASTLHQESVLFGFMHSFTKDFYSWVFTFAMKTPYLYAITVFAYNRARNILLLSALSLSMALMLSSPIGWISSLGVTLYQLSMYAFFAQNILIGARCVVLFLSYFMPSWFSNNAQIKKHNMSPDKSVILVDKNTSSIHALAAYVTQQHLAHPEKAHPRSISAISDMKILDKVAYACFNALTRGKIEGAVKTLCDAKLSDYPHTWLLRQIDEQYTILKSKSDADFLGLNTIVQENFHTLRNPSSIYDFAYSVVQLMIAGFLTYPFLGMQHFIIQSRMTRHLLAAQIDHTLVIDRLNNRLEEKPCAHGYTIDHSTDTPNSDTNTPESHAALIRFTTPCQTANEILAEKSNRLVRASS